MHSPLRQIVAKGLVDTILLVFGGEPDAQIDQIGQRIAGKVCERKPGEPGEQTGELDGKEDKKRERWQKIAEAAAKQCGRGIIPLVDRPMTFSEAVEDSKSCQGRIIPYENEESYSIKSFAKAFNGNSIALFIGPEGGFSPKEIQLATTDGIKSVTLGKRILRTETAGIVAGAVLLYELED